MASAPRIQSQLSQDNLASSISSIIECSYGGVTQRLARTIGKSKSSVWGWKYGRNIPSLREMLRICYTVRISLLDLLTSDGSIKTDHAIRQLPSNSKSQKNIKASSKKMTNVSEIEFGLRSYLDSDTEPIPMEQVAGIIGHSARFLRKKFPEICKQISHRYLSNLKTLREQKRSDFIQDIMSSVTHLHSLGQPITREQISRHLNRPSYNSDPRVCGPMWEAKRKLGIIIGK